ncbi:uncharacterized protein [Parasteatoda tepidariorum]|uniref:uncharacterized protein n=1 Tax=Parasteatoda tepidariorum TaxID=114398 RepID=UPI0039BD73EE
MAENCNKVSSTCNFIELFSDIERGIREDLISILRKKGKLVRSLNTQEWREDLKVAYTQINNPLKKTNVVILACKYQRLNVLEYLLHNDGHWLFTFRALAGGENIKPGELDHQNHDAFYYAIKSSKTELLELLLSKWPDDYFTKKPNELEDILSLSFNEIKLKNIRITEQMNNFVEYFLLKSCFFQGNKNKNVSKSYSPENIKQRIELVVECVGMLKTEYMDKEADDKFLFISSFIIQNISVLKRLLKFTYDSLPWEEMEFCLIVFISFLKPIEKAKNEIEKKVYEYEKYYRRNSWRFTNCVLTQSTILKHLGHFSLNLEKVANLTAINSVNKFLQFSRKENISAIIKTYPLFEDLLKDYAAVRDVYSLEVIKHYLEVAIAVDSKKTDGQLIISRTLQVLGENLKNTVESPKLSDNTCDILLLTLTKTTRSIVTGLRNALSHEHALQKRKELEGLNCDFYSSVQNDLNKLNPLVTDILRSLKRNLMKLCLQKLADCNSLEDYKHTLKSLRFGKSSDVSSSGTFDDTSEIKLLQKLIPQFFDTIGSLSASEEIVLHNLQQILNSKTENDFERAVIKSVKQCPIQNLELFYNGIMNTMIIEENDFPELKKLAKRDIKRLSIDVPEEYIRLIANSITSVYDAVKLRVSKDKFYEVTLLYYKILRVINYDMSTVTGITEMNYLLTSDKNAMFPRRMNHLEKYHEELKEKLELLHDAMGRIIDLKETSRKNIAAEVICETNLLIEVIMLDIMSILDSCRKFTNNPFYCDGNHPILGGKNLRNHLAHGNVLNDVLFNSNISILLNAKIFVMEDVTSWKKQLDRIVIGNPSNLKLKFEQNLEKLSNQAELFYALACGDLDLARSCIEKGADIEARDINLWTALHYASQASNTVTLEFIISEYPGLFFKSIEEMDVEGRIPLHIAAFKARKNSVEVLLKNNQISINAKDVCNKTALHIASQVGSEEVVEVLLKNGADTEIKDMCDYAPLHFAICHNHVGVTIELLKKEKNVDDNLSSSACTPLILAAEKGFSSIVTYLLQKGADVNRKNDLKSTPMHLAADWGHAEVLSILIQNGAEIDCQDDRGVTPLHCAVRNRHKSCVEVLLKNGAKINIRDYVGRIPIHFATYLGEQEIAKNLLRLGGSLNMWNYQGWTALHCAAYSGNVDLISTLVDKGATINVCTFMGLTPLHISAQFCNNQASKYLMEKGAGISCKDKKGRTPLHVASASGDVETVKFILKKKPNAVNDEDKKGWTALHHSCFNNHGCIVKILIEAEANINKQNNELKSPLHLAVENSNYQIIDSLTKQVGCELLKDLNGCTPLHYVVRCGQEKLFKLVASISNDVNVIDKYKRTALHYAVDSNQLKSVKHLVEMDCKIDAIDENGLTALATSVKYHYMDIVNYLLKKGANRYLNNGMIYFLAIDCEYRDILNVLLFPKHKTKNVLMKENIALLQRVAAVGNVAMFQDVVTLGLDVNAVTGSEHLSALHIASERGCYEIVKLLVQKNADVNIKTRKGDNALHLALAKGHVKIVWLLLAKGAIYDTPNSFNRIPLESAVLSKNLQLVRLFIEKKQLDVNYTNANGHTLLHLASEVGSFEIASYLIKKGADVNVLNKENLKPIHITVKHGNLSVMALLYKYMSLNQAANTVHVESLLHFAVTEEKFELVQYLISKKVNMNSSDDAGIMPLHVAAARGNFDLVKLLVENGSFYDLPDHLGRKPIDLAKTSKVINILRETENLMKAVKHNNILMVQQCIQNGAIVNALDKNNACPLIFVAYKGYLEIALVLLENKANPNTNGKNGFTPLHYASKFGHIEVAQILLKFGAIYNATSNNAKSPADLATNSKIYNLLNLIDRCFKEIEDRKRKFLAVLKNIKDVQTMAAIMNARNQNKKTLTTAAHHCKFQGAETLEILFCNFAFRQTAAHALYLSTDRKILNPRCNKVFDLPIVQDKFIHKLTESSKYHEALLICTDLLEDYRKMFGSDNIVVWVTQQHIAFILHQLQRYQESLRQFRELYELRKKVYGMFHKGNLDIKSWMALVLHRLDRNEEALKICEQIYEKQKKILGGNHLHVLQTEIHMALVLNALGEHEKALKMSRLTYVKYKQLAGSKHRTTLVALNNVGIILLAKDDLDEALKVFKKVHDGRRDVLGSEHRDTIRAYQNVANVLRQQKLLKEAERIFESILVYQASKLGLGDMETVFTLLHLAEINYELNKYMKAEKFYKEAYMTITLVLGDDHFLAKLIRIKLHSMEKYFEYTDMGFQN